VHAADLGALFLNVFEAAIDDGIDRVELALFAPRPAVVAATRPTASTTGAAPSAIAPVAAAGATLAAWATVTLAVRALAVGARPAIARRSGPPASSRRAVATARPRLR